MTKPILSLLFAFFYLSTANANDLSISNVEWQDLRATGKGMYVQLTLEWENAWNNDRNHDAAWIFFKLLSPNRDGSRHLKVLETGHHLAHNLLPSSVGPAFQIAKDKTGIFVYPASGYRGKISWKLRIALDPAFAEDRRTGSLWNYTLAAYGIEMVHIPPGGFTLGDPDTTALAFGSLYRSGGNGQFGGLIKIDSETSSIEVGKNQGQLCYRNQDPSYQGDLLGPVPPTFPKGVNGFYVMKYELTQGQYAAFLNSLPDEATKFRSIHGGREYHKTRGTIHLQNDEYVATAPNRPCNYTSWDDACAFADWAALRPMTELEFEKACRGPGEPKPHEFAWGSDNKDKLGRYVDEAGDLIWEKGLDESRLTDSNRDVFGASYYWVFDLSGGALWERSITIGSPEGRAFTGTHGDGSLDFYGFATNADWPKGDTETSGWGFRGGGYYYFNRVYTEFNPHSPIAYRRFGAWAGGAREPAYGSRFVRTE